MSDDNKANETAQREHEIQPKIWSCFEKLIATHCEIVTHIFHYLRFEDQLRLSRVNDDLEFIFKAFVWRENYESLTVICHENFDYVVTNETGRNRLCLKPHVFGEFLRTYAHKVQRLTIIHPYLEMEIYCQVPVSAQLSLEQFPQLTELHIESMVVSRAYLDSIAVCCAGLESLHFKCCVNEEDLPLELSFSEDVATLARLKCLRHLHIESSFSMMPIITYKKFVNTLNTTLQLESLKVGAQLVPDKSSALASTASCLECFYDKVVCDELNWSGKFLEFTRTFEMLTTLSVAITDIVNEGILKAIATNCKDLTEFNIQWTTFTGIDTFYLPSKVKEFSLCECQGLREHNLQALLSRRNLSKFVSQDTEYEGDPWPPNFQISSSIQSLTLDCKYMHRFFHLESPENHTLRELNWYHGLRCSPHPTSNSCAKLSQIFADVEPKALLSFVELKALEKLTIPHPTSFFDWTAITHLLNRSSLKELTIENGCDYTPPEYFNNCPTTRCPSNIHSLTIPLDIFEAALDFWLDLFACNSAMKMLCGSFTFQDSWDEFLDKLINNRNFPPQLKVIDVFGFTVDCKDLRRNFRRTIKELDRANCEDLFRVILSK